MALAGGWRLTLPYRSQTLLHSVKSRHFLPACSRRANTRVTARAGDLQAAIAQQDTRLMDPSRCTPRPILLFDVMDTVVYDPFFKEMPVFFQMSFQDLLKAKHPTAWVDFECNRIDGAELARIFFADGRDLDYDGLINMMRSQYRFLDGMETLLARLAVAGFEMHALSNYPVWYSIIEDKLKLSRYMKWTFVSCTGPMEGVRKPAPEAYKRVIDHLGVDAGELLFIDDRKVNVQGAEDQGVPSILFANSQQLEQELRDRGLKF